MLQTILPFTILSETRTSLQSQSVTGYVTTGQLFRWGPSIWYHTHPQLDRTMAAPFLD